MARPSKLKWFYIKLDPKKEYQEIIETKGITELSRQTGVNQYHVREFVNSEGIKREPYKAKNGDLYFFSCVEGSLEFDNYPGMAEKIIREMKFRESYKEGFEGFWDATDYK